MTITHTIPEEVIAAAREAGRELAGLHAVEVADGSHGDNGGDWDPYANGNDQSAREIMDREDIWPEDFDTALFWDAYLTQAMHRSYVSAMREVNG